MKRALLISVAAAALAAGSTLALSQGGGQGGAGPGASGGGAAGGSINAPMANPGGSQGGAPGGSMTREPQSTINESPAPTVPGAKRGAQDTAPKQQQKATEQAPTGQAPATKQTQSPQPGTNQGAQAPTQPGGSKGTQQQTQTPQQGGAKQGAAQQPMRSSNVSLTTEQKTVIRNTVITSGPKVTNVNFDIKVGIAVPRTVRVAPVPVTLVEIEPTWRGYMYFVYADEIIIVEPRTLKIVAVLEV